MGNTLKSVAMALTEFQKIPWYRSVISDHPKIIKIMVITLKTSLIEIKSSICAKNAGI